MGLKQQKSVKQAIKFLKRQLAWPVRNDSSSDSTFHITSVPHRREHIIYWPKEGAAGPPRPIEYLHELCHAYLAEKVHPQFSAQYFKQGTPDGILRGMSPVCKAASDWFTDELVYSLRPQEFLAEVKEHICYAVLMLKDPPPHSRAFVTFSGGLIIAQCQRYLNQALPTGSLVDDIVQAFLSVEPTEPHVDKLVELLNRLLRLCSGWQVRLIEDGGLEVWEVVTIGEKGLASTS